MAGGSRRGRGRGGGTGGRGRGGGSGVRGRGRSGRVEKNKDVVEETFTDDEGESVKQKVCKKIDDAVYRDNKLSEGGKMKEIGKVIQRMKEELKRPLNVNCRVEDFGLILNEFCEKKRKIVHDMGFTGLFGLLDRQLPRELCYWLARRVDVPSYSLVTPDGLKFTLDPIQVHWVLGIPKGQLPVPKKAFDEDSKHFVANVVERFSSTNVNGISRKNLVEAVEAPLEDEFEFRVAFLLLALVDILCPTTSYRLCPKLVPAAIAAVDPQSYDWCSLVLEKLMYSVSSFARRFYPSGFSKGCGGCTIFLAIMYVDRLRRPPVKWGVFPRLKAWTEVEINKAKKADRITGGDFGKLGCVNASYGRPHERAALDRMPLKRSAMAAEIAEVLMQAVDVEEEDEGVDLLSTQGLKKRPKEGRGYFGRNKGSGFCSCSGSGSGVHDNILEEMNDINVNDYISTGLLSSPIIVSNEWEESRRREIQEKERHETEDRERQEIQEKERKEREENVQKEIKERDEKEREEKERKEREEKERKEKEEKEDKERQEREERNQRYVRERQEREEKQRLVLEEVERVAREERERVEEEQRLEREERERVEEKERLERERLLKEKERMEIEERERVLAEKEKERMEREERERVVEEEKQRMEREEMERVLLEKERVERERVALEKEQEELDRLEKEKEEYDRVNKEREEKRGVVRGPQSPERIDVEVGFSSEEDLSDDGAGLVEHGERSRRKRKTTATPSRLVQGYVLTWRPRKNRRYRHAIIDCVRVHTNFSPRRQHIVDIEDDPVMLSCDGHIARLSVCAGIALSRGQVVDQYVRVAAKMYEKVWAHRFEGRSRRFMLDPAFAHRVLNMKSSEELDRATRVYTQQMVGLSPNRINVVFVPVVLLNHWWCVAFSLNREEILVIDSMETSTAADLHSVNVQKLGYAMDLVFQLLDEEWPLGTVGKWTKTSLIMDQQGDLHSCGVYMLAAIKRNAERLLTTLTLDPDINVERSWLLYEDLMCEFNEARDAVVVAVRK